MKSSVLTQRKETIMSLFVAEQRKRALANTNKGPGGLGAKWTVQGTHSYAASPVGSTTSTEWPLSHTHVHTLVAMNSPHTHAHSLASKQFRLGVAVLLRGHFHVRWFHLR